MKKLILITALLSIFAACKKEEKPLEMEKVGEMEKIGAVEVAQPELSVTTNITILNKDNNSHAVFFIHNLSKDNSDTVNITFYEPYTEKDFIITKNFPMNGAYGISFAPVSKTTNAYGFNVQVLDKDNKEIINDDAVFFALKKLYPAHTDNNNTPMLDNETVTFNKDIKEQYIFLNQLEEENYTVIENNKYQDNVEQNLLPIAEYGFSNKFTGSLKENTNGVYTINNTEKEFIINNLPYNNCLTGDGIHMSYPCALKITSTGEKSDAVFYLKVGDKYIDTAINLKTE